MIDKAILDEVLPVPELETLKEEKIAELKEEGFAITNFHSGGVFYTLLLVVLRIKIEFTELAPNYKIERSSPHENTRKSSDNHRFVQPHCPRNGFLPRGIR